MRFKGKWGLPWMIVMGIIIGTTILSFFPIEETDTYHPMPFWGAVLMVVICVVLIDMTRRNYIDLEEEQLTIRMGVMKHTLRYSDVEYVKPTWNPLASMALSLDRICIKYQAGMVLVSVRDKEGFMEELQRRNPQIQRK